ncbi:MAG: thioredoxin family protein [Thiobacillus sp.]|nr:thioredoxin family protein [Thiobacillus sp.]
MSSTLTVRIVADGEDALRLHKRVSCAARALGVELTIESQISDSKTPRLLIDDSVLLEGLPRTEDIEQRLTAWIAASQVT